MAEQVEAAALHTVDAHCIFFVVQFCRLDYDGLNWRTNRTANLEMLQSKHTCNVKIVHLQGQLSRPKSAPLVGVTSTRDRDMMCALGSAECIYM